ncbi:MULTISPECIES: protein-export chaperone SecB [Methylobacter]|jgi:protein translocase subunit secB|uniref:Protein-export protein SecB n=1 Tax=Methylobacter tundripaludum (strain ATCC BAA-1195 / DSM 17260 / SV96) TaxID=697282 RepID=G3IQY0_METTV|nr:protein-export chaperone SecB [Methylobacter tundripaludum]EGW23551.1 Protein-export protein secB [Methylobacter tundripaludum SV96]MDD4904896.1 protein-export chaperone SecB [Methylobacter tundripaludum]
MTEATNAVEKQFSIQKIYTKDMSFETPNSPKVFTEKWEPTVDFNLGTNVLPLENSMYEVALAVTITVKNGDATAYLVEVNQAGIFSLGGFTNEEMGPMVGSFCPNILFPYAREAISDLVTKGGFPQMLLAPVNFDALYSQHLQQAQQAPGSDAIN